MTLITKRPLHDNKDAVKNTEKFSYIFGRMFINLLAKESNILRPFQTFLGPHF